MRLIDADKIEYYDDEQGFEIAYKVDIDALPTLTPPNEWVSVEERLPEFDEYVLVTDGSYVGEGYINPLGLWFRPSGFRWLIGVTHWMSLPAPPDSRRRRERPMLERVARAYLEICGNDCAGDDSAGIAPCQSYFRRKATPLTFEQLHQMYGQWVWWNGQWCQCKDGYVVVTVRGYRYTYDFQWVIEHGGAYLDEPGGEENTRA